MASSDQSLAHRYGQPRSARPPSSQSGPDLLQRSGGGGGGSYHQFIEGNAAGGAGMCVLGMANGRSNRPSPVIGNMQGMVPGLNVDLGDASHHYQQDFQQQQQQQQSPTRQQEPQPGAPGCGNTSASKPIRRRMRMITSCLECRRRKLKCNKSNPCTNCLKFARDCLYLGPKLDEASQLRLTEIKEKVGSLERQLERDVAKSGTKGWYGQRILADGVEEEFDEERDLEITPMVALDLTYDDDADGTDDIVDLGVQVGKMRLSEKIGGLNRPRISEEIQAGLSGGMPQFGGLLPGFGPGPPGQSDHFSPSAGSDRSLPDFLRPGTSYIPPTSGVFFGQIVQSPSLLTFLPTKPGGDRLLERYFEAVHPIARCVHRPSFETQYENFWEEATAGFEPRASVQAVVFAAWFSAAVAMDEAVINREFGFTKANLVENMKIGTEVALSKANFLRTTRVETMQAFVMYMIPLCREEVSRAHSVLVGAAVRMAECMGLNRDGSKYNLSPLDTHVRRLIWHQLCFLDIRTCEAQGPKPAIRREDYDTWLPDNCEEDQLTATTAYPPRPSDGWTSTLISLIRFEINEMMRILWADRRKLEARKITLTQVLTKVESFRKRMLDSYDRQLDEREPIQRYAKLLMHLLLYRLHVMVLHPYYANTANPMPQRLRSVLIASGIMIIELAVQLGSGPAFAAWAWYAGAYQQYQAALILATEMFYHPAHKEAARIWACLDYVFGLDRNAPADAKGKQILVEIMAKMGMYMSMRKTRAPILTAAASPAKQAVVKAEEPGGADDGNAGRPPPPPPTTMKKNQHHHLHHRRPAAMKEEDEPDVSSSSSFQQPSGSGTPTPTPTTTSTTSTFAPTQQMMPPSSSSSASASTNMANPPNMSSSSSSNNMEGLCWGAMIPPPLPATAPSSSLMNPDSPGYSSSDGGGGGGSSSNGMQHNNKRQDVGGMHAAAGMMDGGSDWSYQEDAINALFPYDPQTGTFAGFGDPLLISGEMSNNNTAGGGGGGGGWAQRRGPV